MSAIEVEVKLPVADQKAIETRLLSLGFVQGDLVEESDFYFNGVFRDFKKTDEALRIRSCHSQTSGESFAVITYKGPKLDSISMTRKELETKIADPDIGRDILCALGFRPVHPVHKLRRYYRHDRMTACADRVEGLGDFLELEVIVTSEEERRIALEQIEMVLRKLGYDLSETTRISYLSMLEAQNSAEQ